MNRKVRFIKELRECGCGRVVGLGWVGLGWVGLGWVGLGWVGLVGGTQILLAASQPKCMLNTICCIYNKIPPDDE
jgi:hypothetical protein